ncbi:glycosyltransferase family 2 protein [Rathayibacter sp. CAU 1779]
MAIDIMMPFYGDPDLLRDAVASVLAQTSPDWRLTVIDDAYPDPAPGEWVASLGDDRIRYLRNGQNLGVAGNFQRALDLSTADHLVIMGCDDLLAPDYVERMVVLVDEHPTASYIQPGVQVIDEHGAAAVPLSDRLKGWLRPTVTQATVMGGEGLTRSLLNGNWTYFPSICWRRAELVTRGFRADYEVVLDLALQLQILLDGGTLVLDPTVTFRYRRHGGSVSSWKATDGTRFHEEAALFSETRNRLRSLGWKRATRAARFHWTSRLNALTRLPAAIAHWDAAGIRALVGHAFGS